MASLTRHVFTGGICNLAVGKDEVPFDAHVELLCSQSPFFDNALNGRFKESETKLIPLPNEDPDTFAEFLSWTYSRRFFITNTNPGWLELSKLWVLADKYQVPELQNNVMELFPQKYDAMGKKGNIHPTVINYVYDNTMEDSQLRKMIVDICAWGMDIPKFEEHRKEMPTEFLEDFALVQMKKAKLSQQPKLETYPPAYFVKFSRKMEGSPGLLFNGGKTFDSAAIFSRAPATKTTEVEGDSSTKRNVKAKRGVVVLPFETPTRFGANAVFNRSQSSSSAEER